MQTLSSGQGPQLGKYSRRAGKSEETRHRTNEKGTEGDVGMGGEILIGE